MEMQLFLREDFKRNIYCHGRDWHPMVFVEELKTDGMEQVVCTKCKESAVVGPTIKCRICPILCHVSCFDTSTLYFHFGHRHDDQLIFIEELRSDDGKEGVVCMACDEQVEGPGYKCSTSECNFRLHKSCAQLPRQIQCHPSHPKHILILSGPRIASSICSACGKWCHACLFYRCSECNFNLDFACATRTQINNIDDCQHAFITFFKQIHFTCEACGQEGTNFASLCSICQLFIHSRCAGFPRTIISKHHHPLTLIYSFHRQAKDFNDVFCNLCRQKVKTKYAAFYCQECNFVAHMYCAEAFRNISLDYMSQPDKPVAVMDKIKPSEIRHFSHPHNLILSHDEVFNDKLCDGCMNFIISSPFYNCTECHFFLHTTCAQLPKNKSHLVHPHRLTLLSDATYMGGSVFCCNACGRSRHGFTYRCDMCDFDLDVQCCSIPEILKHEGHQHSLFLPVSSNKNCNACDHNYTQSKNTKVFVCTTCDFALGFECAILPLVARHKYDEHPLALTYVVENNSGEYYCLICEKERDSKHWFYYCAKCDFPAHPQCVIGKYPFIKFGRSYKSEMHQHPLTCVRKTRDSPPCDACGNTFDGMAIECTQCKFIVHWMSNCVLKYKY